MYHYTDGGLKNVWLFNGYIVRNTPYGQAVSIEDLDGLCVAICLALVKKQSLLSGAEFRYVRSAGLMQSQAGLASMLGNNEQAIARWEKSGKVPRWADKLIRVFYLARIEGGTPIAAAIESINTIERAKKQKIEMKVKKAGWASKLKNEVTGKEEAAA